MGAPRRGSRQGDVIFLGEWHGFRENVAAAGRILTLVDIRTLALEIGAEASLEVEAAMSPGGVDSLAARWREAPYSLPFLWWQDEAAVVADFLATGPTKRLAGFDREFSWSAREAGWTAAARRLARMAEAARVVRMANHFDLRPFVEAASPDGPWTLFDLRGSGREAPFRPACSRWPPASTS